ncbi:hypothetical protein Fcan01_27711 [Folsomia candida]|uniref:Uncharacterized protein n=1 Tax=Folsomia candida TaxID=158441 RepID=A0A226CY33_FOLCA|nr:hypothetical protein Fcan01_27711 [Folsomia candida]
MCEYPQDFPLIHVNSDRDIILTRRVEQFGFLACSPLRQPKTSLAALFGVYKVEVWISVLVTMTLASLFILLTANQKKYMSNLFTTLSIGFAMLLEQGAGIDKNLKKQRSLYFIFGPWIMMSLIITNSIRGDNVTKILAPLRIIPYEKFSQLFDAQFKFMDRYEFFHIASNDVVMMPGYRFAMEKSTWTAETSGRVISNKVLDRIRKGGVFSLIADYQPNYKNLWRHHEVFLGNGTLTDFRCAADFLAYVGWMRYLRVAKLFLEENHPGPEYSLGNEFIEEQIFGWKMEKVVDPRVIMRVKGLVTSGISGRWLFYEEMGKKSGNLSTKLIDRGPVGINLKGNMGELFTTFVIFSAATAIWFLFEIMYNGARSLKQYGIRKAFLDLILALSKLIWCAFKTFKHVKAKKRSYKNKPKIQAVK